MATGSEPDPARSGGGLPSVQPAWDVAHLFPAQGDWTESDFFRLHGNRMAELVDGCLEVLPMPTWMHQLIVDFLCDAVKAHLRGNLLHAGGRVLFAPLPVRLFPSTIREPDVLYIRKEHLPADPRGYPDRVDLAMEVVSEGPEARRRDYIDKRRDYARAGISEYWIVDPEEERITVLALDRDTYREHGVFRVGDHATSKLFEGLTIEVAEVMALADRT